MATPITGYVHEVGLEPGVPFAVAVRYGPRENSTIERSAVFATDGGARVRCAGAPVTGAELFAWLLGHTGVWVTLRPDPSRYGVSLETDFFTDPDA
jgi:hypothetical protein